VGRAVLAKIRGAAVVGGHEQGGAGTSGARGFEPLP
jgi:hypothetical protein